MTSLTRRCLLIASAAMLACSTVAANAQTPAKLTVNTFPNAKALGYWAGMEKGIFTRHGIDLELFLTENSKEQRAGLASGKFMIAHSALDNAIDLIIHGTDVLIVTGGDAGMNEFMVQGDVKTWADIKGRWLAVDAPDTAYALQAKKILAQHGLKVDVDYQVKPVGNGGYRYKAMLENKQYAAAILNLPFTIEGMAKGLKSMGRTIDMLGPYQAGGAFVLRKWAADNGPLLERFIKAYVETIRWVRNDANTADAIALLIKYQKISPEVATETLKQLRDPAFGYTPDAKFSRPGFDAVLALRAEVQGGRDDQRPLIEKAVDLGYYERALK